MRSRSLSRSGDLVRKPRGRPVGRTMIIACVPIVVAVASVTVALAHPCDTQPDDPRCSGTTTTVPTTTTTTSPPASTTTTTTSPPASTTTTTPPPGEPLLGIVSASNGDRYWNEAVESLGLPSTTVRLGGGVTHDWGTPTSPRFATYWAIFDDHAAAGAVHVWWYAMSRSSTVDEADAEAEADVIVAQILALRPEATIHASPMAAYDPDTCSAENIPMSDHLVAYAIESYEGVVAGPVIPIVTTTTDGCHPGGDSLSAGAAAVAEWAAGLSTPPQP